MMRKPQRIGILFFLLVGSILAFGTKTRAAELHIGGASATITPKQPVALSGQMRTRIAQNVASECIATALALESREGDKVLEQAIMVSCDLVAIRDGILDKAREKVKRELDDFDPKKLFLSATHTHTAPVMREGAYELPAEGIIKPAEYVEFLTDQVADAAVRAWRSRKPGQVSWGLGHAVVAQNRRSVYADGRAQMYGRTNSDDFRGIEGYEDHGVEVLFFAHEDGKLFATAINVACPSQEVESKSEVDADFWHPVRESLQKKYGKDLLVLGWTGASGDQSPHLMYRKAAEERMRKLRGLTRLEEIARRVVGAWEEAYAGAKQEMHSDVPFVHKVQTLELPIRRVTAAEAALAKEKAATLAKDPKSQRRMLWERAVVDRYERQQAGEVDPYQMELHAIRLGDVAIATNDFELFTEFGIQMKSRSPALQTFIIQLSGPGSYVPTARAANGGGYSAIVQSNKVGPQGGQVLADETVKVLKALWGQK